MRNVQKKIVNKESSESNDYFHYLLIRHQAEFEWHCYFVALYKFQMWYFSISKSSRGAIIQYQRKSNRFDSKLEHIKWTRENQTVGHGILEFVLQCCILRRQSSDVIPFCCIQTAKQCIIQIALHIRTSSIAQVGSLNTQTLTYSHFHGVCWKRK